jgi:hypothetical protein
LRDSNENHIFINEKLNHALKKANQRIEDFEAKIAQYEQNQGGDNNNNSKKSTDNTSAGSLEKVKGDGGAKEQK